MLFVLLLLWSPTLLILAAFAGLAQFKLVYAGLSTLAQDKRGGAVWRRVQPCMFPSFLAADRVPLKSSSIKSNIHGLWVDCAGLGQAVKLMEESFG